MSISLKNLKIVNHDMTIENAAIIIKKNKISDIISDDKAPVDSIDCRELIAIPGFIDMHIHGSFEKDFMDSTIESWKVFLQNLPKGGTTSVVGASITASIPNINKALKVMTKVIDLQSKDEINDAATLIGCHMEGPYISPKFKGAHKLNLLRKPNLEEVKKMQEIAKGNIKIITYAPELADENFTTGLIDLNIIPSVGHSGATFLEATDAFELGANHTTHLYNAMSGFHHRKPGIVAASLNYATKNTNMLHEIICDGIHLRKEIIKITYSILGPEQITLVTDSISPAGCQDGSGYKSGGFDITKKGGLLTLTGTDTIAGSGATMIECFRNIMKFSDASINDAVRMSSYNAAVQLKIDNKVGTIKSGLIADIIIVDKYYEIVEVFIKGKPLFGKLTENIILEEEF